MWYLAHFHCYFYIRCIQRNWRKVKHVAYDALKSTRTLLTCHTLSVFIRRISKHARRSYIQDISLSYWNSLNCAWEVPFYSATVTYIVFVNDFYSHLSPIMNGCSSALLTLNRSSSFTVNNDLTNSLAFIYSNVFQVYYHHIWVRNYCYTSS